MAHIRFLKSELIKSIFSTLILAIVFLPDTNAMHISTSDLSNHDIIKNIDYEYQIVQNDEDIFDCFGTLNLSLTIPPMARTILLERTLPHKSDDNDIRFLIKTEYPLQDDITDISVPNIYWGTYFRICIILTDESRVYSPILFTNNYIEHNDLQLLEQQSSLGHIENDPIHIVIENGSLRIESSEVLTVSIFDISGKCIFTGRNDYTDSFSLNNIKASVIIVKCYNDRLSLTKKLLVH